MRKYRLIALRVAIALLAAVCQSAPPPTVGAGLAQSDAADLQPPTGAPEKSEARPPHRNPS